MPDSLLLSAPENALNGKIQLPASKSESNRVLTLRALSRGRIQVHNLSEARDTQTMLRLLEDDADEMNVGHAGTAMRFLTSFLAFRPADKVLTGSSRMQQRPIGLLVEALRTLGADIHYLGEEGYPPLMIFGRNARFGESKVRIPGNVSSQYISALLMIAPTLPDGLKLEITGKIGSRPYIEMTLGLMARFGIQHRWEGSTIEVERQFYTAGSYTVEADWSAASYWYSMVALSPGAKVELPGLRRTSFQGDHFIADMMAPLGVKTTFTEGGVLLEHVPTELPTQVAWDFSDCPDLAQGLLPMLSARGIPGRFTGLESLRIKETDRIAALQNELAKFGMRFVEEGDYWNLEGTFVPAAVEIPTYEDHRMAMGFAPLALVSPGLRILEADVVQKSYPRFWEDLAAMGFGTA